VDAWRLIIDPPSPAPYNMAVDEALVESCRRGASGPTVRVYGWEARSISLGYFQRPDQVVDLDRCRDAGIPVVRRTTGGRAVFHHHEVTYSVAAPVPHSRFPPTIRGTYDVIARVLEAALASLGLPVTRRDRDPERPRHGGSPFCFDATSRHEITLGGMKVVGSAQRRWPTAFLQHGSILMSVDPSESAPWFRGTARVPGAMTGLRVHGGDLSREDVCQALVTNWERLCGVELLPGELSVDEAGFVAKSSHARDLTVIQPV
jgi:lipoate-protein ligase A